MYQYVYIYSSDCVYIHTYIYICDYVYMYDDLIHDIE